VFAQKLLPDKAAIDVPVALAILALGVLIIAAPGFVRASCHRCNGVGARHAAMVMM